MRSWDDDSATFLGLYEIAGFAAGKQTPEEFVAFVGATPTEGKTLYVDGEPVCVGGVTVTHPGLALTWLVANTDLKPYATIVVQECSRMVDAASVRHTLYTPMVEDPRNVRFIQRLGFKRHPAPSGAALTIFTRMQKWVP